MFLADRKYKLDNGIYSFINEALLTGDNLKYKNLYDRIAWTYNLSQRLYWFQK